MEDGQTKAKSGGSGGGGGGLSDPGLWKKCIMVFLIIVVVCSAFAAIQGL